ncbi:hypothetical protein H2136_20525 [Aeromonas hydrophila]|uniref:Uncharacterized protein n=1 Tax=Aeromonas hydrophila TaxID=644 RepID=A0A926FKF5_AERHY|nr:hypothetical protein [Aeromonas hydrophila]
MRQTVAALQSLVDSTGVETLVDPTLYQRFKVSRVPTIILTDGVLSPAHLKNRTATQPRLYMTKLLEMSHWSMH